MHIEQRDLVAVRHEVVAVADDADGLRRVVAHDDAAPAIGTAEILAAVLADRVQDRTEARLPRAEAGERVNVLSLVESDGHLSLSLS